LCGDLHLGHLGRAIHVVGDRVDLFPVRVGLGRLEALGRVRPLGARVGGVVVRVDDGDDGEGDEGARRRDGPPGVSGDDGVHLARGVGVAGIVGRCRFVPFLSGLLILIFVLVQDLGRVMKGANTYRLPDGRGPRIGAPFASLLSLLSTFKKSVQMSKCFKRV